MYPLFGAPWGGRGIDRQKYGRRSDGQIPSTGKVEKLKPARLGASRGFTTFSAILGSDRKTSFYPGTGLVGDGDTDSQRTPSFWIPWPTLSNLIPLVRLSWWGGCLGPANYTTSL